MRRSLALATLLLLVSARASAQPAPATGDKKAAPAPAPPAPTPAPAPAPVPPLPLPPHAGAILHLAAEIGQTLGAVPAGTIVVASAITSDVAAPKGDELAVRIATQLAGRIGGKAHPQAAALAVARGVSGRASSLVYLQIEIAKGELRVTADLYPVVSNGWERLRNPVPGPRAHAFAMAPLDAEIRGFLVPVLLEQAQLHRIKHDEGEVLAVGCGDLDGDGGLEIVLVTKLRVAVGRIRGGKLIVERSALWSTIASRAPFPMREPLASVLVSPRGHRGEILVGTTDRGGVAIDAALVARRQLTGLPVPGSDGDACALPVAEAAAYDSSPIACDPPPVVKPAPGARATKVEPPPIFLSPLPRYDVVATLDAVARDGSVNQIIAAREPGGKLKVRKLDAAGTAKTAEATMEGAGAQLALVDLDLDGVPEVVTSSDGDERDALVVSSFVKNQLTARLRFPARDGVRAIGVCPPEERGVPGLVAVVGNEVWLVR